VILRRYESEETGVAEVEDSSEAMDDDVTRPASEPAAPPRPEPSSDSVQAPARAGPATLKRVAPPEKEGEIVPLSADEYLLGRSHACDIPLLSSTASRRHARIVERGGEWILYPLDGKTAIVDGRPVFGEVRLRHDTKVQLGADELVFLQDQQGADSEPEEETLVVASERAAEPSVVPERSRSLWIAIASIAALAAGLAFWLLL